ncbi:MAG TPA: hypothetical protein VM100_07435 [Longimicrobiales bacterium]|nr:hypothetical protein [Longimicrobiales bacterium]
MFCYPGGTPLDAGTRGYSLTHNFLSDLGMTVSYSHAPNRLGAALFVASLLLLVIGAGICISTVVSSLSRNPGARSWIRMATVSMLLACVAFIGVAFTPENRAMSAHVAFTIWGWRFVPVVAGCLGIAMVRAHAFSRSRIVLWFVSTGLLALYVAIGTWGPSVTTMGGLTFQVVAQKAAALVLIAALLLLRPEKPRLL